MAIMVPTAGTAGSGNSAVVPSSLLQRAQANANGTFDVIITASKGHSSKDIARDAQNEHAKVKRQFKSISGVSASVSGKDLLKLARHPHILSIVPDQTLRLTQLDGSLGGLTDPVTEVLEAPAEESAPVEATAPAEEAAPTEEAVAAEEPVAAAPALTSNYKNGEMWRQSTQVEALYGESLPAPAIAIVDSGVDASKAADFGSRVVAQVNFSSLDSSSSDAEGHGTMVAAIAAGASPDYPGVSPTSNIVDVKTANAEGMSVTSDVIAAADWILENKDRYNIRVANFSMAGAAQTSFRFDPLDKAVERLWFSGIVVVAAAGNHGQGSAVSMSIAPANDPFIITVGAVDQNETADPYDDSVAPWSAYGTTMDGFSKPDMVAPGRYMVAAVPMDSTIAKTVPERIVGDGYMWMSGTSFAAPVVAGTAAQLLARYPDWGPDQVKGALMLTSAYLGSEGSGVGEIDALSAAYLGFTPPNPNENLYAFVGSDSATGGLVFNEAGWSSHVQGTAGWSSANWSSAGWSSASWSSANWASASWSSANWSSNVETMMSTMVNWSESTFAP